MIKGIIALLAVTIAGALRDEIIFAVPIFRHGARHMIFTKYANISKWQGNPGELTNVGRHQLYLLGREMANQYMTKNVLLTPHYDARQIEVSAAGLSRTVESAQSFLAGLYEAGLGSALSSEQIYSAAPPITVQDIDTIREELRDAAVPNFLKTVPIKTGNVDKDFLFNAPKYCNTFAEEERRFEREFNKINKKNKEFYKKLTDTFGFSDWDTDSCYFLYDNIATVLGNGKKFNITIPPEIKEQLKQISLYNNLHVYLRSELKAKLAANVILSRIRDYFSEAVENSEESKPHNSILRMGVFSVSDMHINAIHRVFGWEDSIEEPLPFASVLVFELHKIEDSYGNLMYTVNAKLNGVERPISRNGLNRYREFHEFLESHTYRDYKDYMKHCSVDQSNVFDRPTYFALSIVLFISFIALWGSNWVYLVKKQQEATKEVPAEEIRSSMADPIND